MPIKRFLPLLLVLTSVHCNAAVAEKPNFVLIFADDLGYGDVGYQGGDVPTPHIDSIAGGGVTFTDGYVTCPVCAPSRAGLLTGRYQQSFGFWDNIGPYRVNEDVQPGIPVDVPILSERLKELGYTCGLFGKTHDGDAEEMMAFNRWDKFYGFNNGASNYLGDMNRSHNPIFHNRRIVSNFYAARGISNDQVNRKGVLVKDEDKYLTDMLGDQAVRFIEANKGNPFLCYMPFNAIHGPFQAPKRLVDKYAGEPDEQRRLVKAMLDSMDQNVGKVLKALRDSELEEDTLVVFLSDNGGHEASPSKPLRGKKGTYWEGGLRVPFCMQWKGKLPAGKTYGDPVISLDVMPTFLRAAGSEVEQAWNLDGIDILPFVSGEESDSPHRSLYWVWGNRKAVRAGNMKALSLDDGQTWQLFDLVKDISEQTDLAGQRKQELQSLVEQHQKWESKLMPQQWGWKKELGYKDPDFGKPQPYHEPHYFSSRKSRSMSSDGLAAEMTDINARDTSAQKEADLEYLTEPIVSTAPSDLRDGLSVGSLASATCDEKAIRSLTDAVANGKYESIDSMLIAHKGTLVLESYYRRGRPDVPHYQMSITKSVTALALGRAMQLGYLNDLNMPVVGYLNGVDQSSLVAGAAGVTLAECLNMHSGIRIPEAKAKSIARQRGKVIGQGQVQMILSTTDPVTAESKEHKYQGTDPTLVMQVIEAIVPGRAEDFIRKEVLKPLGITNYSWQADVSGFPKAAAGSSLRSRDMLKIGLLIADNGKWKSQQLWPADFIKTAVSPLYTNRVGDTYGYFWWGSEMEVAGRKHHCISARGAGGQFIFIVPTMDLVVVVTSHNKGRAMRLPFELMKNDLLPAFVAE